MATRRSSPPRSPASSRSLGLIALLASTAGATSLARAPRCTAAGSWRERAAADAGAILGLRGGMRVVADEEELDQILMSDDNYGKLVVLDFFAEWCGPCKKLTPVLEELEAKAKGKVKFLKVDVDQSRELSGAHGVTSMPTLEFYRNGEKIATMVGANIVELKERVNRELMNPMLKLVSGKVAVGALLGAYLVLPWQRILAN